MFLYQKFFSFECSMFGELTTMKEAAQQCSDDLQGKLQLQSMDIRVLKQITPQLTGHILSSYR